MLIANYRGRSWQSRCIRFVTRSEWSHTAFLFDARAEAAARDLRRRGHNLEALPYIEAGSVVEAWFPVVRNVPTLSAQHTPKTVVDIFRFKDALSENAERQLILDLVPTIGEPYSVLNILRFLTRRPGNLDKSYFCSELVWEKSLDAGRRLHECTEAWEVPPNWIARSLALDFQGQEVTC